MDFLIKKNAEPILTERIPEPGVEAGAMGTILTGAGARVCLIGTIVVPAIFGELTLDVWGEVTSLKY